MMFLDQEHEHLHHDQHDANEPTAQTSLPPEFRVANIEQEVAKLVQPYDFAINAEAAQEIVIKPLAEALQATLREFELELLAMRTSIIRRQNFVIGTHQAMRERLQELVKSDRLTINEQDLERSKHSVFQYVRLLEEIAFDVERERQHLAFFLAPDQERTTILVDADQVKPYEVFVSTRLIQVRRYIRRIEKDLEVSFSRYTYGFTRQFYQLEDVEFTVQMQEQYRAEAAAHKAAAPAL